MAVGTFGRAKAAWLRTLLALPGGIPSHDTCGRVFARLDPVESRRCFLARVGAVVPDTVGQVVALDGKTLRRAHDRSNGKAALHMVGAWACGSGLVLGQPAVDEKSHASTALPALPRLPGIDGATVTSDAMGGQTAIAAQIVAQGADYALALQDNHPTRHAEVAATCAAARAHACADYAAADHDHRRTSEKNHGRIETRRYRTIRDPATSAYLHQGHAWAGRRASGLVERQRRVGAMLRSETRYYLLRGTGDAATFGGPSAATGGLKTASSGSWMSPFARTSAAPMSATVRRIWRSCATSPSTCCARSAPRKGVSPPSASAPPLTTLISSPSSPASITNVQLPCAPGVPVARYLHLPCSMLTWRMVPSMSERAIAPQGGFYG